MLMKFNSGNHDRNTFIRMTMTIKTLRVHTPTELNLSTPTQYSWPIWCLRGIFRMVRYGVVVND